MLMVSSLLLWAVALLAVVQVPESHANPQFPDYEISHFDSDNELCRNLDIGDCVDPTVNGICLNLCGPTPTSMENPLCWKLDISDCVTPFVKANCPTLCGSTPIKPPLPPPKPCRAPWFKIGDQCFQAFGSSGMFGWLDWQSARDHCKRLAEGGDLAHPKDVKALADHLNTPGAGFVSSSWGYWLGGTDEKAETDWRWVDDNERILPGREGGWAVQLKQPNDAGHTQNCLSILQVHGANSLVDYFCEDMGPFLCEMPMYTR